VTRRHPSFARPDPLHQLSTRPLHSFNTTTIATSPTLNSTTLYSLSIYLKWLLSHLSSLMKLVSNQHGMYAVRYLSLIIGKITAGRVRRIVGKRVYFVSATKLLSNPRVYNWRLLLKDFKAIVSCNGLTRVFLTYLLCLIFIDFGRKVCSHTSPYGCQLTDTCRSDIVELRGYFGEPEAPGQWFTESNFGKCKEFIHDFKKKWDFPSDFSVGYVKGGMHCIRRTNSSFTSFFKN